MSYEYVIIGAGIAGCSSTYFLSKHSNSVLLIDKNEDIADGASGAAGAFLSPLLGKPNKFKDLVTDSLNFSTNLYKEQFSDNISNCGVLRIPKDEIDEQKFQSYKDSMDFTYEKKHNGYFFEIGSVVSSKELCKALANDVEKRLNYKVETLDFKDDTWVLNDDIKAKNIIWCTGADVSLIKEEYLGIRPVWGQRIDVETKSEFSHNYHKECSVSRSFASFKEGINIVSIGATHHRNVLEKEISEDDTKELLKKAADIVELDGCNVIKHYGGARSSSKDYFPMVGELIDSSKTLNEFPYMRNGTHVNESRFSMYPNLFVLNGVGGRGFVLSPYLANELVKHIVEHKKLSEDITTNRLFKRWVKR